MDDRDERDERDDYVWHFKLLKPTPPEGETEALSEMVREQVEALLCCLTFTDGGRDVRVTGFRFFNKPDQEHLLRATLKERTREERSADREDLGIHSGPQD